MGPQTPNEQMDAKSATHASGPRIGAGMVSFGIGAALVTLGVFAAVSAARLLEGQRPPELHWKVMRVPGSVAGILWAIANFCGIAAVARGGNAVVMAQMQVRRVPRCCDSGSPLASS